MSIDRIKAAFQRSTPSSIITLFPDDGNREIFRKDGLQLQIDTADSPRECYCFKRGH
jgi:hypothetical protein